MLCKKRSLKRNGIEIEDIICVKDSEMKRALIFSKDLRGQGHDSQCGQDQIGLGLSRGQVLTNNWRPRKTEEHTTEKKKKQLYTFRIGEAYG